MLKKLGLLVLVLAMLPLTLPAAAQEAEGLPCLAETDMVFLENHGYALTSADQAQFTATLVKIVGDTEFPAAIDTAGFTTLEALLTTLYFVNVDELGYTYPADKVTAALSGWDVGDQAMERQQELAAAIDTGLLGETCQGIDFAAEADAAFANYLIYKTLIFTGNYKHFLGYSNDPDIYNKVYFTWNSFDQVLMPEFQIPANELIKTGVITGYNVKRIDLDPGFDPELTIVYGHSNIAHAIQLIGLLRSEDMEAKVLLEPKTSAYLYLAEWGEPSPSPEFQVEPLEDGNYIAYAKEYDLAFEFDTKDDMLRFDAIIKAYAKKNEQDQPGLLFGSWWQPLYSTRIPMDDYIAVKNTVALGSEVYIQSFSLAEDAEALAADFAAAYPDNTITSWDLWVNVSFYNYLMGNPG
jgi:hypothetical protein